MLDVFGFPTPQGANYQAFYGGGTVRDWVKPRGASMVRMLLIGAGSAGSNGATTAGGSGGASGAVTQWIGPAIFIPDVLRISIGAGGLPSGGAGGNTTVIYQQKDGTGYTLLTANGATGPVGNAGAASSNNFFGAAGIFKSIAGASGAAIGASVTASSTIFLSGGAGGANLDADAGGNVALNYGYPTVSGGASGGTGGVGQNGYFFTQPILIGAGGAGGAGSTSTSGGRGGIGGIGCGGGGGGRCTAGGSSGGRGGDGAVFIWSW
jgi:hypothetical protein